MSEEVKDEQSETAEEKSLEDQIAALEDIASALKEEVEEKSDDEDVKEKSDDEAEEAPDAEDEIEEKGLGEADHSKKECKDMENCPWHSADAEEAEESDGEEKSVEGDEKARTHPVVTGYPYDRVEMQPGDPEFDEEEEEKNVVTPKKRRVVVVEMDPSEITEDMKAYVVDIDDEEEEAEAEAEKPYHDDEEEKRRVPLVLPKPDDEEDESAPPPRMDAPSPPPPPPPPLNAAPTPDRLPPPPPGGPPSVPAANPRLARLLAMANERNEERDDEEEDEPMRRLPRATLIGRKDDEPEETTEDSAAMSQRLKRLGLTTSEIKSFGEDDFMCGIERKVRTGDVCNFCRGGCASEKGLPSLLEIEVAAETEHKGEVVDSGYAPKDDMFVLDIKTGADYIEAYYAGNGAPLGWIMLDGEIAIKSGGERTVDVVSFGQAEQTALKHVKGKSLGVDVDIFQGEDAYVVEIDGADGKSYDAYVGVDGQFLGSDMIDFTEDEEVELAALRKEKEALESELHLKRAYANVDMEQMVADGMAIPNGSFPILTSDDLEHAVRINYRLKSVELQEHIERRAEQLDRSDLIPAEWVEEKSAQEAEFVSSLMELEMLEAELPIDQKREYTDDTRQDYAESGLAMEDGSYPIRDVGDLKNAIQAFGRSKNPDATKKHIKKRARSLGATDLLPDNWE